MNSSDLTKVAGGFLGTVFVLMTIGIVSDSIFAEHHGEVEGYAIEVAEGGGESTGGGEAAEPVSIVPMIATADAAAGESGFKKCAACHTNEKGGANKVGPNLYNVVNRAVASVDGFNYSSGMKEFSEGQTWTYENLDHFLAGPKKFVKGTSMGFAGLKKDSERAEMIAFLRTLSDSPAPLPAAEATATEESASAPSEEETKASEETAAAEQPAAEEKPAETAMASAGDAEAGEKVFRKCKACHTIEEGGANKVGPNIHNIVGRAIASIDGFKYSSAMIEFGQGKTWTEAELMAFLENPKGTVKGTKMGFAGLKKPEDVADLMAYLKANSAN